MDKVIITGNDVTDDLVACKYIEINGQRTLISDEDYEQLRDNMTEVLDDEDDDIRLDVHEITEE